MSSIPLPTRPMFALATPAAPTKPTPIHQTTARADPEGDCLRMLAQSRATRNGQLAPYPADVEEARRILAALNEADRLAALKEATRVR